jgi:hypothetical protein
VSVRAAAAACLAGALLPLAACRTVHRSAGAPAVIVDPTAESRAALAAAVGAALGGAPVTLAVDALTRSSTLTVERATPPGASAAGGRDLGAPERFELVKQGDRCILVHAATGRTFVLARTACSAGKP